MIDFYDEKGNLQGSLTVRNELLKSVERFSSLPDVRYLVPMLVTFVTAVTNIGLVTNIGFVDVSGTSLGTARRYSVTSVSSTRQVSRWALQLTRVDALTHIGGGHPYGVSVYAVPV